MPTNGHLNSKPPLTPSDHTEIVLCVQYMNRWINLIQVSNYGHTDFEAEIVMEGIYGISPGTTNKVNSNLVFF